MGIVEAVESTEQDTSKNVDAVTYYGPSRCRNISAVVHLESNKVHAEHMRIWHRLLFGMLTLRKTDFSWALRLVIRNFLIFPRSICRPLWRTTLAKIWRCSDQSCTVLYTSARAVHCILLQVGTTLLDLSKAFFESAMWITDYILLPLSIKKGDVGIASTLELQNVLKAVPLGSIFHKHIPIIRVDAILWEYSHFFCKEMMDRGQRNVLRRKILIANSKPLGSSCKESPLRRYMLKKRASCWKRFRQFLNETRMLQFWAVFQPFAWNNLSEQLPSINFHRMKHTLP